MGREPTLLTGMPERQVSFGGGGDLAGGQDYLKGGEQALLSLQAALAGGQGGKGLQTQHTSSGHTGAVHHTSEGHQPPHSDLPAWNSQKLPRNQGQWGSKWWGGNSATRKL